MTWRCHILPYTLTRYSNTDVHERGRLAPLAQQILTLTAPESLTRADAASPTSLSHQEVGVKLFSCFASAEVAAAAAAAAVVRG